MDSSSEKLCLQWNDFKENITNSFRELREDNEFTDVTLACEDGQQIEAHKVVLASSSPFFMELLKRNKHPHPLLYMRGLKSEDLMAVLDFLYRGEANVFQENLEAFLALAEELRLKGLTGDTKREEPKKEVAQNRRTKLKQDNSQKFQAPLSESNFEETPPKDFYETTVALTNDKVSVGLEGLDEQIKSMFTKSDVSTGNGQGKMATCNVCGNEGPLKTMPRHIEANHITGVSHTCDICGKISRSRHGLRLHISNFHQQKYFAGQEEQ